MGLCAFFIPLYTELPLNVLISHRTSCQLSLGVLGSLLFVSTHDLLLQMSTVLVSLQLSQVVSIASSHLRSMLDETKISSIGSSMTGENVANEDYSVLSSWKERIGNWAAASSRPRPLLLLEKRQSKGKKNAINFPNVLHVSFFLIGYFLDCYRSLTIFQSSYKVILASL